MVTRPGWRIAWIVNGFLISPRWSTTRPGESGKGFGVDARPILLETADWSACEKPQRRMSSARVIISQPIPCGVGPVGQRACMKLPAFWAGQV